MNNIEENKNYITAYAFTVNDSLIGKALASPTRRLLSILLDTIVIGSLTLMSTSVMAACVMVVSIVGSIKARNKDAHDGTSSFAPQVLSIAAVISGLFLVVSLFVWWLSSGSVLDLIQGQSGDQVSLSQAELEKQSEGGSGDNSEQELSVVSWLQAALTDLGIGFGWAAIYFSASTAWFHGQTLGKALFRIRVLKIDGKELSLWESFERYGGYSAGLATGLLGFLQVIWDPNRQAIHDKISETVVIDLTKPDRRVWFLDKGNVSRDSKLTSGSLRRTIKCAVQLKKPDQWMCSIGPACFTTNYSSSYLYSL